MCGTGLKVKWKTCCGGRLVIRSLGSRGVKKLSFSKLSSVFFEKLENFWWCWPPEKKKKTILLPFENISTFVRPPIIEWKCDSVKRIIYFRTRTTRTRDTGKVIGYFRFFFQDKADKICFLWALRFVRVILPSSVYFIRHMF